MSIESSKKRPEPKYVAMMLARTALIEAVRAWANSDCGAMQAERVLKLLAEYDDANLKAAQP